MKIACCFVRIARSPPTPSVCFGQMICHVGQTGSRAALTVGFAARFATSGCRPEAADCEHADRCDYQRRRWRHPQVRNVDNGGGCSQFRSGVGARRYPVRRGQPVPEFAACGSAAVPPGTRFEFARRAFLDASATPALPRRKRKGPAFLQGLDYLARPAGFEPTTPWFVVGDVAVTNWFY